MPKKLTEEEKIIKSKISTKKLTDNFQVSIEKAGEWIIVSPIYLPMQRKTKPDKKAALNLNAYRNRNFIVNNNLKKDYKEWMKSQLEWKVFQTPIEIVYTLYRSHKPDLMNVTSIVDKFFCDTLQEYWCIPDDNVDHIAHFYPSNGWRDKDFPRMEIKIL